MSSLQMKNVAENVRRRAEEFCDLSEIENYFDRLFPICRSILGQGYRDSLAILRELVPFELESVRSGMDVLDWTVPDEWNIEDAYIITPDGDRIAQFKDHNLHVVHYSEPVDQELTLEELKDHLFTVPDLPDHLPYVTSYYHRRWGFCISQRQFDSLKPGIYRAVVKSEIKPGRLVYGQAMIPGRTDREVLISTYLCHPQMANHELSGPLVQAYLYKMLKATGPHRHTFRFLICPENIGAAAFLHDHGDQLCENVEAGYVVNCVGHGQEWTYKRSRQHASRSDVAAINTLRFGDTPLEIVDFFPDGSDERQFCSPGFNLPVGLIMRQMFGRYPEYHTSADDKNLISFDTIRESVQGYFDTIMALELDFRPYGRVQRGSPMLSKSPIPLYRNIMNFRSQPKNVRTRIMLEILNLADGNMSLLDMAESKDFRLLDYADLIADLVAAGYISEH